MRSPSLKSSDGKAEQHELVAGVYHVSWAGAIPDIDGILCRRSRTLATSRVM